MKKTGEINTNSKVIKIFTNRMKVRKHQIPSEKEVPNSSVILLE